MSSTVDATNSSGNDGSERELIRKLRTTFGLDVDNRVCNECGSRDVHYVRHTQTPTHMDAAYNCAFCAADDSSEWDTIIPLEYARAKLLRDDMGATRIVFYDARGRLAKYES